MAPKGARKRKADEPEAAPEHEKAPEEPTEDEGEEYDEDEDEDDDSDYARFMHQIKEREQELDKYCMVLGHIELESEDEDEDEEEKGPSMEQLQALPRVYVPKEFETYFGEVGGALEEIGCSDDEDEEELTLPEGMPMFKMRMLNTRHSLPMQAILQDSLKKVDKAMKKQDWPEAFCWWAATTLAAKQESHWYSDTEDPPVVEAIYKKLRTQWLKLREHSDEELGGLVLEGSSKTRNAELDAFLQGLADQILSTDTCDSLPGVVS
eukprot:GHUV01001084.1.p1 GENE.GHUV01001084.1~~GHUV01001084.1.p1  ORF type:complete len:265 (+),score=87.90 GHUV01001084.1:216-1010(+)